MSSLQVHAIGESEMAPTGPFGIARSELMRLVDGEQFGHFFIREVHKLQVRWKSAVSLGRFSSLWVEGAYM